MTIGEIQAMVSFLNDDDAEIVDIVTKELSSKGFSMFDTLEKICWKNTIDPEIQEKLELILKKIVFKQICPQIEALIANGIEKNLLEIISLFSKITYPRYHLGESKEILEELCKNLQRETNPTFGITRNISEFNRIFYDTYQFRVAKEANKYHITNFMLKDVLAFHIGDSSILSIIYWLLADCLRNDYGIEPVILPNNILLAVKNAPVNSLRYKQLDVLFYINPADRGNIYKRKEITDLLDHNQVPYNNDMLEPRNINDLLRLYLKSLSIACHKNDRPACAEEINNFMLKHKKNSP